MNWRKFLEWAVRQWNQNVIGKSPPPRFRTWPELASYMKWGTLSEEDRKSKAARQLKEFDDETWLLGETFKKLIGLLIPLGLILAFGRDSLKNQPLLSALFIASFNVSTIGVVWALSTRTKVFQKPDDNLGLSTLMVDDGTGKMIVGDELGAGVWSIYTWRWHRHCTRVAIDRMFFFVCMTTACTLGTMLVSVVT